MEAGYAPSVFSAYGSRELEVEILDALRGMRPAGVLLAPLGRESNKSEIERFCRDVPTVLFDSNLEGLGEAFVGSDNFSFVSQTVDYLARSGQPPVFFEMRHPANPNANKRRIAYLEKMEALDLTPQVIQVDGEGWAFEEIGRTGALKLLASDRLTSDTVLCSNDRLAIGFLSACYDRGVKVGRIEGCVLRVASHDDHPFSRFTCPALTTAAHDYEAVSRGAMETLSRLIEAGGSFNDRTETLHAARLIMRDSA